MEYSVSMWFTATYGDAPRAFELDCKLPFVPTVGMGISFGTDGDSCCLWVESITWCADKHEFHCGLGGFNSRHIVLTERTWGLLVGDGWKVTPEDDDLD